MATLNRIILIISRNNLISHGLVDFETPPIHPKQDRDFPVNVALYLQLVLAFILAM